MNKFDAHILVVDDDDGIRSLVKKYLNENKFLITTANSAEDASRKIKIIKFDLIILDIMMPGKTGLEFIAENASDMLIFSTGKSFTEEIRSKEVHFLVQNGAFASDSLIFDFLREIKEKK